MIAPAHYLSSMNTTLPKGNEIILVVEHDSHQRKGSVRTLEGLGYQVLEAVHHDDAMDIAQQRSGRGIDLLVTSLQLPQSSGKELAEHFIGSYPEIKVLFTAETSADAAHHPEMLNLGVALLSKPFTAASLAHKVREVLDSDRQSAGM